MSTPASQPRKLNLYQILGLAPGCSEEAIKQAYKTQARKYHPDLNQGNPKAEAAFKAVGRAYEVLGNPEKRRLYDEALEAESDSTEEADVGIPRSNAKAEGKVKTGREWVPALFGVLVVLSVIFFFFDTPKGLYFLVIAVALEIRTAIESVRADIRR